MNLKNITKIGIILCLLIFIVGCSSTTITKTNSQSGKTISEETTNQLESSEPLLKLIEINKDSIKIQLRNNYDRIETFTVIPFNDDFFQKKVIELNAQEIVTVTLLINELDTTIINKIKVIDSHNNTYAIIKVN